jgi:hypothetical protein
MIPTVIVITLLTVGVIFIKLLPVLRKNEKDDSKENKKEKTESK